MNPFGQEKKIIGQKQKVFTGQLIFLPGTLLEDFLGIFLILLDLLVNVDFFCKWLKSLYKKTKIPKINTK